MSIRKGNWLSLLALGAMAFSSLAYSAEKGACRYVTIEHGRTVTRCVETKGNDESCKNKSVTDSYRWCPGETCKECPELDDVGTMSDKKNKEKDEPSSKNHKNHKNHSADE